MIVGDGGTIEETIVNSTESDTTTIEGYLEDPFIVFDKADFLKIAAYIAVSTSLLIL